ncbi:MAG: nucleotide exchange factor GrpE [Candidatus Komeilibacteria bacterium RIFOXYC1_FULL_37_11]|uniref:Protein GrpE n=1 Tax=Candidatus Komeilibacteria bacterium RIFOXYC1_FULL_37_11 TaxID=1798555 RepID=A0A1G2BZF4_9BACT|nr:MAG: nucleotide exchange factor GrpE [Candidatus Komeilibacteria bacterium RIFOXYC1_FULL_37_11]OGY95416.1 MAG: nucleotide exchange factor GrpE [Candidatus Komeilibacteria bacterium RIFOXYD1_FULL_37_29]OGY96835.1 MAG: nucleotide exchange factor GrpE [Candidatus Komeilibacteria bacterium RIFOXYD2_FULL_37_8]
MSDKDKKDKDKKHQSESGVSKIEQKIDFAQQATENLAGWQKALADYQNLQKEMDKRLSGMNDFVAAGIILDLLPIFDNYQIAISHIPKDQKNHSWAVGLEHILKLWATFLADYGVEKIQTIDQKFNPHLHETVGEVNNQNQEDQMIVEEKLAGYSSKDRVIRPAKVIINNKN